MAVPIIPIIVALGPPLLRGLIDGVKWLVSQQHRADRREAKEEAARQDAKPRAHFVFRSGFWWVYSYALGGNGFIGGFDKTSAALEEAEERGLVVVDTESYHRHLEEMARDKG